MSLPLTAGYFTTTRFWTGTRRDWCLPARRSSRCGPAGWTCATLMPGPRDGELWLSNLYIAPFDPAGNSNHDPRRRRKLLLHRDEINRLAGTAAEKGFTIVALRLYIKNHVAKAELALARGKRQYDKRQTIINRELDHGGRGGPWGRSAPSS